MTPTEQAENSWYHSELKQHEAELRRFVAAKAVHESDVEDIVQESFIRLIRIKSTADIRAPRGLLFALAKNIMCDLLRKKYRNRTDFLPDLDAFNDYSDDNSHHDKISSSDEQLLLQEAIRSLPKKCKVIFVLHYIDRLSHKQISERLGVSSHTVHSQLKIGMRKCREFFESRGLI